MVIYRPIWLSVKNTAVNHLQTIRPADRVQGITVHERHLTDILNPFPQVAFHHRCAIGKGVLSYRVHRVRQFDLFQLIAFLKQIRRNLRHAFGYVARCQVPPVAENSTAESCQSFRQRDGLAGVVRIIGLIIRRPRRGLQHLFVPPEAVHGVLEHAVSLDSHVRCLGVVRPGQVLAAHAVVHRGLHTAAKHCQADKNNTYFRFHDRILFDSVPLYIVHASVVHQIDLSVSQELVYILFFFDEIDIFYTFTHPFCAE